MRKGSRGRLLICVEIFLCEGRLSEPPLFFFLNTHPLIWLSPQTALIDSIWHLIYTLSNQFGDALT